MEGIILDPEVYSSAAASIGGLVVLLLVVGVVIGGYLAESRYTASVTGRAEEEKPRKAA